MQTLGRAETRVVVAACIACASASACKKKQDEIAQPSAPAPAPTPAPAAEKPAPSASAAESTPGAPPDRPRQPVSIADATALIPKLEGTQLIPLKQTRDQLQVHGTWCIDGTGADDVAKKVGHTLAEAKFSALAIRGDARKAGVTGDRDGMRLSMVVSASAAQICAAPAHYFASATVYRP